MSLFKSTGEPLLTDDFDKWTLIHGTSDLNTEFLTKSSPVSVSDIKNCHSNNLKSTELQHIRGSTISDII